MSDNRKADRRISKSLRPIFPENRGLGPNRRGRRKPCKNCVVLEQQVRLQVDQIESLVTELKTIAAERDELKKVNRAWYSTGGMVSVERIIELEQKVTTLEKFCREFVYYEDNPHEHKLISEQLSDLQAENIRILANVGGDMKLVESNANEWVKAKQQRIEQLEAQLNHDGTTNSQRCDRCHLANFFNGEEFKCWNCGLEHVDE